VDFGVDVYKRSKIGSCTTNLIQDFRITEANELKEMVLENSIDYVVSKFYQDTAFKDFLYYCIYIEDIKCSKKIAVGRVNKKYNDVRIEAFIYYKLVKAADELDSDTFVAFHEILLLDAIIAASRKYKIPEENYKELLERRSKLGTIPEWIPEMEDNPQLVIDMYKASVPR
jgi:hypothetical protein